MPGESGAGNEPENGPRTLLVLVSRAYESSITRNQWQCHQPYDVHTASPFQLSWSRALISEVGVGTVVPLLQAPPSANTPWRPCIVAHQPHGLALCYIYPSTFFRLAAAQLRLWLQLSMLAHSRSFTHTYSHRTVRQGPCTNPDSYIA